MLRLLVPTDFSENAVTAMRTALLLARSYGAEVVFLHAMAKPMVPATSPEEVFSSLYENDKNELHERLRTSCHKLYEELNLRPSEVMKQVLVQSAPIPETILQIVAKEKIDLVIMGAGGINSMKRLLFGSNTLQMIDLTPVPLLVVPEAYVFKGFKQLAVVVRDKDLGYRPGLHLLARICRNYNAALHFLIIQNQEESAPVLKNIVEADGLLEQFSALSYEITPVRKDEILDVYLEKLSIDLFSWLPKKRGFWSDTFSDDIAIEVISKVQLPILVIPPGVTEPKG